MSVIIGSTRTTAGMTYTPPAQDEKLEAYYSSELLNAGVFVNADDAKIFTLAKDKVVGVLAEYSKKRIAPLTARITGEVYVRVEESATFTKGDKVYCSANGLATNDDATEMVELMLLK